MLSSEEDRINQMVNDIVTNAKAEADRLLNEAKKQANEILEKGRKRAEKEQQAIIDSQTKNVKEKENQEIASINLQARREILTKKEEVISQTMNKAEEELQKFVKKQEYKKVLQQLITEAGIAIGGGELVVKPRKSDKKDIQELLSKTAKEITKQTGNKCTIQIGNETIDAMGGVIVHSKDESITIDNTFNARLDQKKDDLRNTIAQMLFE